MKKRFTSVIIAICIILFAAVIAYAVNRLFFTKTVTSDLSKKTIFQFDLSTGLKTAEVGPGDSIAVSPTVYNDATEPMYVFIVVNQPVSNDESLYAYTVVDEWKLVNGTAAKQIYAYAGNEMTALYPGDTTVELTDQMTMRSITNAEYSTIEDINIKITGYAIGIDEVPTDIAGAWATCKEYGNIQ